MLGEENEGDVLEIDDDFEVEDVADSDIDSDSGGECSESVEEETEEVERIDEEKLVDWAYRVMDWLKIAVEAKAWDKIRENAEDIVSAFVILVRPEHRGVVMETFKVIARVLGGGR